MTEWWYGYEPYKVWNGKQKGLTIFGWMSDGMGMGMSLIRSGNGFNQTQ